MPSYMLRGLPDGLVGRAKARARQDGTTLDAVLIRYLQTYAAHGSLASAGGKARAEALTAEQRSAIARHAALSRHRSP